MRPRVSLVSIIWYRCPYVHPVVDRVALWDLPPLIGIVVSLVADVPL
jgi:hypothetical protein